MADLPVYRCQFLRLFGFGIDGVDYQWMWILLVTV